jgi:hypothetical protein
VVRFPSATVPFTERITSVGTFTCKGRTTSPLDILIDISPIAAHGIRGWVLGNKATADDIERVQGRHSGALHLNGSTGSETLISESIWIRGTQSFYAHSDTMPQGLHGIACAFECLDLSRRFERGGNSKSPREVRFLLRGPWPTGFAWWWHEYSNTGNNRVKLRSSVIATGGGLNFSMFTLPHFLHDDVVGSRKNDDDAARTAKVVSETSVNAIACRTRRSTEAYGDDAFFAEARQAVEDMCLLPSFLAGGMITWNGYHRHGPGIAGAFQ